MNKSKLFIIGMLLGFEKGHEIYDGIDWNADMASGLLEATKIAKEDFFATTAKGKSFFEYKKTWENLKKIFDVIQKNGEEMKFSDFKRIVVRDKTAFELAIECKAHEDIFVPEIWAGHANEMDEFWFSIDKWKRPTKYNFEELRIAVARLEGRTIREDRLKSFGIAPADMHSAMKNGTLTSVRSKLATAGDYLRLDDAKVCESDGDHGLYERSAWEKAEDLFAEWEKNGEIPDAEFFQFKRASRASIIERAFIHGMEKKVFNARVFAGRPEEMMKLYDSLKEEHRKKVDIKAVLSEIVEKECAERIMIDRDLSLESLTAPLYVFDAGDKGGVPVIALALKKTWDHMEEIQSILRHKGEAVKLSHLRQSCAIGGDTGLLRAARFGCFEKVLAVAAQSGERIELNDLLVMNEQGRNVLTILAESGQVNLLLQPELWVRRAADLAIIWDNLPLAMKNLRKDDFLAVQTKANQLSLRELGRGIGAPVPSMAL